MQSVQFDGLRKRNGWFIATFLPWSRAPMRQHLFKYNEHEPHLYQSMIEVMMMYPLEYELGALMKDGNGETVTEPDFFANYRIFRVEREHSANCEHAEIPRHECLTAPMQDILIAHIDQPIGEGNNELLMQYQVRSKSMRMPSRAGDAVLGGSQSQLDCMSQMLRTLT
jgi:hypothetical protein